MSTSDATTHSRRSTGTSPSNGQPNDVEIAQLTGTFARAATSSTARSFPSDSATVMLTLARLWLSLAETTVWIASTPASIAAHGALLVRHERDVLRARTAPDPRHDLFGVPHLGHDLRVDEGRHLDARQARLGRGGR